MDAEVVVAVPAALHYCDEYGLRAPAWLVKAALKLICGLLKREKSVKRGRAAGAIARHRQDMIDFMRWDEVVVFLERQTVARERLRRDANESMSTLPQILGERERARWLGNSKSQIFECVSEMLERTEGFGSPESVKRSYLDVQRNMKQPSTVYRYRVFHPLFLQMLGIHADLGYGRGAKFALRNRQPCRPSKKGSTVSRET